MCDHADADLRTFIELRRTDDEWIALAFVCGQYDPVLIVDAPDPAEALMVAGSELGEIAEENDAIMQEGR